MTDSVWTVVRFNTDAPATLAGITAGVLCRDNGAVWPFTTEAAARKALPVFVKHPENGDHGFGLPGRYGSATYTEID